ncbi:MAG: DUF421 domain-containing protein [Clostridia bacterium]|nr:DUF421 domain-containing protein [Clostridia bacterium]
MLITLIRTLLLYIVVVISLRLMGKRQIGQLQPSELVIAMMLSELASIPMESLGKPLLAGVIPIFTLVVAEITFSFLTLKSRTLRKIISGSPTVLIEKGQILEKELERLRYNIDDLLEELRTNGYSNINDIEYAIIESNGNLSVIPKSNKRPVTPDDLQLPLAYEGLPQLLITDGVINERVLSSAGLSVNWLIDKLQEYGIYDISTVFIASIDSGGKLYLQTKQSKKKDKK